MTFTADAARERVASATRKPPFVLSDPWHFTRLSVEAQG